MALEQIFMSNGQQVFSDGTTIFLDAGGTQAATWNGSQFVQAPPSSPRPVPQPAPAPPAASPPTASIPPGEGFPNTPAASIPVTAPAPAGENPATTNAIESVRASFPWIDKLGLLEDIRSWVTKGLTADAIVGRLRQTVQYKANFVGISRADGTLRMNEAQYLQTRDNYRQLFHQFGRADYDYSQPSDFHALFEQEIDPNELRQRLETYDNVTRSGGAVRSAFYVYAGIKLSDDDLYSAVVDPAHREKLFTEYAAKAAKSPPDYETFIKRATEAGLENTTRTLRDLEERGLVGGDALQHLLGISPDEARGVADQLFHGNDPTGKTLSLNELLHAVDFALVGSAASANGFALPSQERLQALRQAGVDRSKALEGYGQLSSQKNLLNAELSRAGFGRFGQDEFERALFLSEGRYSDQLNRAAAYEKSLGSSSGAPDFSRTRTGRVTQPGLGRY